MTAGHSPEPLGPPETSQGLVQESCTSQSALGSAQRQEKSGLGWQLPALGCECHQQLPDGEELFIDHLSTLSGSWWDSWGVL